MNKQGLIAFEDNIVELFEQGKIPYPIHFSGGNEEQLIEIFKEIKPGDWVFSTWRSHYHYLLAGGNPTKLEEIIVRGDSLHVNSKAINFMSSAIVGGCPTIAAGVAMGLKLHGSTSRVWCFIGDGAEAQGAFYEAVRYVDTNELPCIFIIEDNNLSVDTPKEIREPRQSQIVWPPCVRRYYYVRKWPHVQTGKMVKEYM
jgi:pyruvate dehydrogenase E1 component alpha subunit